MTSDKRSQEPEDVALIDRAMDDIADECGHKGWSGDCAGSHRACHACCMPIPARLVREGQIRELEVLAKKMCNPGGLSGCADEKHYEPFCPAAFVHARIAALRQEG